MSDVFSMLDALPIEHGDLDNAVGKLGELPTLIAVVGSSGKSIASCACHRSYPAKAREWGFSCIACLPTAAAST